MCSLVLQFGWCSNGAFVHEIGRFRYGIEAENLDGI